MRSSQIEPVWSQATKITLTSLSCLAGRSRWCTGQEIKAHLCKPIFPTCQLKTEKLVFHQFLKGIGPFSFGVLHTNLGAGCGPETSIYSIHRSGKIFSLGPGVFIWSRGCRVIFFIIFHISKSYGAPRVFLQWNSDSWSDFLSIDGLKPRFHMKNHFFRKIITNDTQKITLDSQHSHVLEMPYWNSESSYMLEFFAQVSFRSNCWKSQNK